jgi:hypothetical protein
MRTAPFLPSSPLVAVLIKMVHLSVVAMVAMALAAVPLVAALNNGCAAGASWRRRSLMCLHARALKAGAHAAHGLSRLGALPLQH